DIEASIQENSLNTEQALAFRIIANHSNLDNPAALRMFLSGPGGTGKSRVINTLVDFFTRQGLGRRLRLCSYTGVAARNIGGMTLHAALSLSPKQKRGNTENAGTRTSRDLVAMWEGVDYLFIDEVSMVSCELLLQIHEAL
ncbi:hypothetical protein PENSPDRAFT_544956, partial [Peniophora sp. CONT]